MKSFAEHQAYLRQVNKFNKDKGHRAKLSEMAKKMPSTGAKTYESPRDKELKGRENREKSLAKYGIKKGHDEFQLKSKIYSKK